MSISYKLVEKKHPMKVYLQDEPKRKNLRRGERGKRG